MTVYWYSLAEGMETFCHEAIDELVYLLSINYPTLPPLHAERLSDEDSSQLGLYLCQAPDSAEANSHVNLVRKRIIVYCDREAEYAISAHRSNPMAQLGAALISLHAMVWTPDKYVFWHEALHLLCIPESYDSHGQTTCEEKNCIMQWNPNQANCNNDLILCKNALNLASAALSGLC